MLLDGVWVDWHQRAVVNCSATSFSMTAVAMMRFGARTRHEALTFGHAGDVCRAKSSIRRCATVADKWLCRKLIAKIRI